MAEAAEQSYALSEEVEDFLRYLSSTKRLKNDLRKHFTHVDIHGVEECFRSHELPFCGIVALVKRLAVEAYGLTEEDLIALFKHIDKIHPGSDTLSYPAPGERVKILEEALPEGHQNPFLVNLVAEVTRELGIGIDRMWALAQGIASTQQPSLLQLEMQRLGELLTENDSWKTLEVLQIWWCITSTDAALDPLHEGFEGMVAKLSSLRFLNLTGISNVGAVVSAILSSPGSKLEELSLWCNSMTDQEIVLLSKALLSRVHPLKYLKIRYNPSIGKEGWEQANQSNGIYSKVMELDLDDEGFEKEEGAAEACFQGLGASNTSVTALNLNIHEGASIKALAKVLEAPGHACKLSRLQLKHLQLTDQDQKRLGDALANSNCPLKELFTYQPHKLLLEGIAKSRLEYVDFGHASFSDEEINLVQKVITQCTSLKRLGIRSGTLEHLWTYILQSSSIQDLQIHAGSAAPEGALCKLLASPECKIRMVTGYLSESEQMEVLAALEQNYQSQLEELEFEWKSEAVRSKCRQLLERNAIYRKSAFDKFNNPSTAKLFVCGHGRVGKTTIRKNLCRKKNRLWAHLQRHASTTGIELQPLYFQGTEQTLLICDLAGQEEFHAFHHYFLRGSENDLFLVVCKVEKGNFEVLEKQLIYWLRFIISHQSASPRRKPKVIIALNLFHHKGDKEMEYNPVDRVTEIISGRGYKDVLDLGDDYILKFVATNVKDVQDSLRPKLGKCLEKLLSEQPQIPQACVDAKSQLVKLKEGREQNFKVIPVDAVGGRLLPNHSPGEALKNAVKFVLNYLHDCGDAIYFGLGQAEEKIVSEYVVLDTQWFLRDIIEIFIRQKGASNDGQTVLAKTVKNGRVETHTIQYHLKKICGTEENVKYILTALHEMGIILRGDPEGDEKWEDDWSNLPAKVMVPALLEDKYSGPQFTEEEEQLVYWGRRFGCKDKKFKLLPAGMFSMLQVKIHKLCEDASFTLGDGWVAFKKDLVNVVVRVGGDTDDWKDRQWVDVMTYLSLPKENSLHRRKDEENYIDIKRGEAETLMRDVKDCIIEICLACPSLELEEGVMRRSYMIQRLKGGNSDNRLDSWETVICPVDKIAKEARKTKNLREYWHTWDATTNGTNSLGELLMPFEQEREVEKKAIELDNILECYKEHVVQVYGVGSLQQTPQSQHSFKDPDIKKLAKMMWERLDQLHKKMDYIISTSEQILANCSKMLLSLGGDLPKYPYLVAENNSFLQYCKLGSSFKIQYLCEWSSKSGHAHAHEVKRSKGVAISIPSEWLQRLSPVLKPALILLFFGIKIGTTVATSGAASMVNTAVEGLESNMINFLDSWLGSFTTREKPTQADIQHVFDLVREKVGTGKKIDEIMEQHFGLYRKSLDGNFIWVCKDHKY